MAIGIIAEYNPFHNGHLWHLQEARRSTGIQPVIAVMSGSFTQRGEPAILDKWTRAAMAVRCGIDLVLELPTAYAVRSAQHFAAGGVRLLGRLGCISHLCFGAEDADITAISAAASTAAAPAFGAALRHQMQNGSSYAAALTQTLSHTLASTAQIARNPNNLLGIEYAKAAAAFHPSMRLIPIRRTGAAHNAARLQFPISSATAIRSALTQNTPLDELLQTLPPAAHAPFIDALSTYKPPVLDDFSGILLARLRHDPTRELARNPEVTEGLEHRFYKFANRAGTCSDLLEFVKTKRYPWTRLQRILIHALLRTTANQIAAWDHAGPGYARVLAFNDHGRQLLKCISATGFPVIHRPAAMKNKHAALDNCQKELLHLDTVATDLYQLVQPSPRTRQGGQDFLRSSLYLQP